MWLAATATALLGAFLVLRMRWLDLALHIYLGVLACLGVGVAFERAVRAAPPAQSPAPAALLGRLRSVRRRPRPERPRSLEELEHAVDFSRSTAFDVHYRLRPHLARIAAHRLAGRRGIDLERQPEAAASALGPVAWDLVRPGREAPLDRNAPGLNMTQIRAALDALEAV